MAFAKRTVDVQLEIYVTNTGVFDRAIGTRRVEVLEDGVVIAERSSQIAMTLTQVKNQVAAL
jgi:hypothetical protein